MLAARFSVLLQPKSKQNDENCQNIKLIRFQNLQLWFIKNIFILYVFIFWDRYTPDGVGDWCPIADMFSPRSNFASVVLDGMIFAIGGFNGNNGIKIY